MDIHTKRHAALTSKAQEEIFSSGMLCLQTSTEIIEEIRFLRELLTASQQENTCLCKFCNLSYALTEVDTTGEHLTGPATAPAPPFLTSLTPSTSFCAQCPHCGFEEKPALLGLDEVSLV